MIENSSRTNDESSADLARVTGQIAARLTGRGVTVHSADSPDELASLLEAVEAFETAVEAKGGDLMVDEAPAGRTAQPDNPEFVLPGRQNHESAAAYISRITTATSTLRH